ncbi:hypothetical protein [Nonomuraea sp. KM90]
MQEEDLDELVPAERLRTELEAHIGDVEQPPSEVGQAVRAMYRERMGK